MCRVRSACCHGFGLCRFGSSLAWCVPVPRFRWLVCGSSLAGCPPVPREGFDLDLDLDCDFGFVWPSAPFLISASGSPWGGGEIRNGADGSARRADAGRRGCGADFGMHSGRTRCRGPVRALCGVSRCPQGHRSERMSARRTLHGCACAGAAARGCDALKWTHPDGLKRPRPNRAGLMSA